ncbi:MAG: 50S ribosomal protein L29 [Deltaproteobacteria bacterium]|jgi:ribosomal protein L29|nr:50S ribosomal protein L29 [Deltaproteobacteria bacterium]
MKPKTTRQDALRELRLMTVPELRTLRNDLELDLVRERLLAGGAAVKDVRAIRKTRRRIARALTIINEKLKNPDQMAGREG